MIINMKVLLSILFLLVANVVLAQRGLFDCPLDIDRVFSVEQRFDKFGNPKEGAKITLIKYNQVFDCDASHHFRIHAKLFIQTTDTAHHFEYHFTKEDTIHNNLNFSAASGAGPRYIFNLVSAEGNVSGNFINGNWTLNGSLKINMRNRYGQLEELNLDLSGKYIRWKKSRNKYGRNSNFYN